MNNDLFQQARSAYVEKDYETALADFTECLKDSSVALAPGEIGLLYHQIGNCLVNFTIPTKRSMPIRRLCKTTPTTHLVQ